jgi:hypothetical protein
MASRRDFYFRQLVSEDELDAGFTGLEDAERNSLLDPGIAAIDLDTDHGGIHSGLLPTLAGGLTVVVPAGVARDSLGRRIAVSALPATALDLSKTGTTNVGDGGTPIGGVLTFPGAGLKRWVSLFVFFDRDLSVPRTDGTGAEVFFVRDESFRFFVSQGAAAVTPTDFVPQLPGKIRLMDFRVTDVGTIDLTSVARRQVWLRAVTGAAPTTRAGAGFPIRGLVAEDGIRATFEQLLGYYNDHVNPAVGADAHPAAGITYVGGETWHDGTQLGGGVPSNMQAAFDAVQTDLKSAAGSDKVGSAAIAGSVDSLGAGSVFDQLDSLLDFINDRLELSASAGIQTIADAIVINGVAATPYALDVSGVLGGIRGVAASGPAIYGDGTTFGGEFNGDIAGLIATGTGANSVGLVAFGTGVQSGLNATAGGTGIGARIAGGGGSVPSLAFVTDSGFSVPITSHGVFAQAGTSTDVAGVIARGHSASSGFGSVAKGMGLWGIGGTNSGGSGIGGLGILGEGGSGPAGGTGVFGAGGPAQSAGGVPGIGGLFAGHPGHTGGGPGGHGISVGGGNGALTSGGGIGVLTVGGKSGTGTSSGGRGIDATGGEQRFPSGVSDTTRDDSALGAFMHGGNAAGAGPTNGGNGIHAIGGSGIGGGLGGYGGWFIANTGRTPIVLEPLTSNPSNGDIANGAMWVRHDGTDALIGFKVNGVRYKVIGTAI